MAKGRGRYLCPYKLYQLTGKPAQQTLSGFYESTDILWNKKPQKSDLDTLHEMAEQFANRTFNGDRDTWHDKINDELWSNVTSDRHSCLKNTCPNRPECPFFLAREMLDEVDVIVANHDLLLSDIRLGGGVILPPPEQSFYCIDEAHHLSKKALKQFAAEHSLAQVTSTLEHLSETTQKIAVLCNKMQLINEIDAAAKELLSSFNQWQVVLEDAPELNTPKEFERELIWLWEDGNIPDSLNELTQNTCHAAQTLYKHMTTLDSSLAELRRDDNPDMDDQLGLKFGMLLTFVEQANDVWQLMATTPKNEKEPPLAKWIAVNTDGNTPDYRFHASPISSANMLVNGLWRRAAGAVLTSATLQSLGNFNLLLNQTGLVWLPETTTLALSSPFDFTQQGQLYIPPLIASPKNAQAHTDEKAAVGTLVLFSSRKQMTEVAFRLPENLLPHLLIQGEQSQSKLLEAHYAALAEGKPSIILGLDSFAEGLDLPHEACVHVIIAKLPFAMPDNPIEKTQSRWIEKRGGSPFMEITVPEASIKLIQAVGRLIRTEQDYGRITLLDNRVITQRYGQQMLACLPPFQRIG